MQFYRPTDIPGSALNRGLIVTADDFGIAESINDGIRAGIACGIVNTVSAMTNLPGCVESLLTLHADHPEVGIGVHLNITTGQPLSAAAVAPSLVTETGTFPKVTNRVARIAAVRVDQLRLELRRQIVALRDAGITVDHLSSQHNLLMLYSPFFELVIELAREFLVPVRCPVPLSFADSRFAGSPIRRRGSEIVRAAMRKGPVTTAGLWRYAQLKEMDRNRTRLDETGVRHPELTVDALWGSPTPETLHHMLSCLPQGVSELIVHLGRYDPGGASLEEVPCGVDEGYFAMREMELAVITSPLVREWIDSFGYRLCGYGDLPAVSTSEPGL